MPHRLPQRSSPLPRARRLAACAVLALALLGAAKGLAACVDLDSLGSGPTRIDAAPLSPDAAEASVAVACERKRPVERAGLDDAPSEELPRFVMAVDQAVVDPDKAPGFDLDGVCTCENGAAGSCVSQAKASRDALFCDLDGGIDNTAGKVAKGASVLSNNSIDAVTNRLISSGRRTLLFELGRYNGRANDNDVALGALVAEGIVAPTCPGSTLDTSTNTYSPGRCGKDEWVVSPASIFGNTPIVVGTGFVRDYQLVVELTTPLMVPFTLESSFRVEESIVTGRIVPLGEDLTPRDATRPPTTGERSLYRIEQGLIAGRVATSETLKTLGSFRQGGVPLCATAAFDAIRERICSNADLALSPDGGSGAAGGSPCDALSMGVGFVAVPAVRGGVFDGGVPSLDCNNDAGSLFVCP